MSRVGEKIQNSRIKSGMSQKALGRKLGVSEGFINEVEMGKKVISHDIMDKISKILGKNLDDMVMSFEEETFEKDPHLDQPAKYKDNAKVNEVWTHALGSVLKAVPIYKYNLKEVIGTRDLPVKSNKIEGYAQDKVFYIQIEDDDMIGFRIAKGDMAFCHTTQEITNSAIYLVEYGKGPVIRQTKRLDAGKVLLISSKGNTITETIEIKNLKILAKLDKIEIEV